jgi:predicted O-linked N-acetylglucosamine transferase (SPINDLY family)
VTLASFNNPAKINSAVIDVWTEILRKSPRAKLLLKYHGLDDDRTQQRLRAQFVDRGLPADRIALRGWSSFQDLLAEYNQVDIALDPFPFSGGATSCNALWMGVPLITCPGETFASRHGLSYLSAAGLTDLIAGDRDEYVRLAVGLTKDLDQLAAMRAHLREQMAHSPLCDGRRHAANLLRILRDVWRNYCASP